MRVRTLLTAAGVATALLATTLPADAATTRPPQSAITRTEAQQLAKAGVLTKSDLPKYDVERRTRDASDDEFDAALYACLGAKVPKYLARNPGRSFILGALTIDSTADVLTTARAAKADFSRLKSKKGPACYQKVLGEFLGRFAEVQSVTVKRVPVVVANAQDAFAYKVNAALLIDGDELTLDGYLLSARVGPTEIIVSPGRFNGGSASLKQTKSLANKVAKRVAAI